MSGLAITGTSESDVQKTRQAPEDGVHLVPRPGDPEPRYWYKQRALSTMSSFSTSPRQLEQHLALYYERLRADKIVSDKESKCFSILYDPCNLRIPELTCIDGDDEHDEASDDDFKDPLLHVEILDVVTVYGSGVIHDL